MDGCQDPSKCPNRRLISEVASDLQTLGDKVIAMDKESAVNNVRLETHYKTIITMLTDGNTNRDKLMDKVAELERVLIINDYKTNQATDVISKVTWGLVAKVTTIIMALGIVAAAIWKG